MKEEVFVAIEVRPYDTALVAGVFRTRAGAEAYCASRGVRNDQGHYNLEGWDYLEIEVQVVQP